jgi:hypothetical protein
VTSQLGDGLELANQEAARQYRQADVLRGLTRLVVVTGDGASRDVECAEGTVVLSQTCDLVRPNPATVQVARLVRLGASDARDARDGKRPRYVHVPAIGNDAFADLDLIATVDKTFVLTLDRLPGVQSDQDVRTFGRAVGRRPARFPFPDEVTPWLQPLEKSIGSRSRRPNSPEGRLLDSIAEIRVEAADGWQQAPFTLTLVIIVHPGVLPTFAEDEVPACPTELADWLYDEGDKLKVTSAQVAERLLGETSHEERHWLWDALGESWSDQCRPDPRSPSNVLSGVASISAEVISSDEYTLNRYRSSEELDLDHLSPPAPR